MKEIFTKVNSPQETTDKRKIFKLTFLFMAILLIGTLALLIWSWKGNVEESITGVGQIIPEGKLRKVMAPTNGMVVKVHVKENQDVEQGQLLVELDPEPGNVQKSSLAEEVAYLHDEINALRSALGGKPDSRLGQTQNAWLNATKQAYQAQLSAAEMQIDKVQHLYRETEENIKKQKSLLSSNEELLKNYETLNKEKGLSDNEYKTFEQKVIEQRGNLAALNEELKSRKVELSQAKEKYKEVTGVYQKDILTRLTDDEREVLRLSNEISKTEVGMKLQQIKAPIDGIVNEQSVRGFGDVVTLGDTLLSLVPTEANMIAEVRVNNKDLSYVRLDQKASIRLDAFPYQQFGRLDGRVIAISPSTIPDEEGKPFYTIRIRPDKQFMERAGVKYKLRAGMTLTADIITREKSVLSFFTEPIQYSFDRAFRDPSTKYSGSGE